MKSWFRKKRQPEPEKWKEIDLRLQSLDAHYKRIEETIERLAAKSPQIIIENVHIHQPVLEKMEYRLDSLDIEQLSGSLNLGNNFGTKMGSGDAKEPSYPNQKPSAPASKTAASSPTPSAEPAVQQTPSGYRVLRK
ncbi:hypothetical protein [Paenibacillus thermotolerans]|uniref:hypothetical protein n=1 Tax=Paenibacillus thermotolerans TaxID=3027807 RepID=UPI00236824A5|nr:MULTISPECIES: hypothetical protein [unclassified Paenibacillus]